MEHSSPAPQIEARELISLAEREFLIKGIPFFSSWSLAQVSLLSSLMEEFYLKEGALIVSEGDIVDSIYLIASGSVEISKKITVKDKTGTSLIALLNPGDIIGLKDTRLFSQTGIRTATATASTDCSLLKISIASLEKCTQDYPELNIEFQKNLDHVLKMQFIKEAQPFSHLTNERIAWMTPFIQEKNYEEGEIIFKEKDEANSCYMICEGQVTISKQQIDGQEKILDVLTAGAFLGESALLSSSKRLATAVAKTPCKLFILDHNLLAELSEKEPIRVETLRAMLIENHHPVRKENIIFYHKRTNDDQDMFVLKDPEAGNYFQLNKESWLLWQKLEGKKSFHEILREMQESSGKIDSNFYLQLINDLFDLGFIYFDAMDLTKPKNPKASSGKDGFASKRYTKIISINNSDSKITSIHRKIGFLLFNKLSYIVYFSCILYGFYAFYMGLNIAVERLRSENNFILLLFLILFLRQMSQLLNPLIKSLMIKHFKYEIPNVSLVLNGLGPTLFLDTSDLLLSPRWPRIAVSLSGLISDLLLASLASILSMYTQSFLFFWLFSFYLYAHILRQLNPLLDLEGYNILSDALDSMNLRKRALLSLEKISSIKGKKIIAFLFYYLLYFILVLMLLDSLLSTLTFSLSYTDLLKTFSLCFVAIAYLTETWFEYNYHKRLRTFSGSKLL